MHDDLCAVVDEHGRTRHVFAADAPNELWLTDITEHRTAEGKLYLCAIKDVYSGRIVGYSIDSRMKSRLAVQALENAVAMRGDVAGCIVHSDRGSQFRSRKMLRALSRHRMVGSMGRVGSSGDNAAMESFFALLQKNVLDRRTWTTREQLRIAGDEVVVRRPREHRLHDLVRVTPRAVRQRSDVMRQEALHTFAVKVSDRHFSEERQDVQLPLTAVFASYFGGDVVRAVRVDPAGEHVTHGQRGSGVAHGRGGETFGDVLLASSDRITFGHAHATDESTAAVIVGVRHLRDVSRFAVVGREGDRAAGQITHGGKCNEMYRSDEVRSLISRGSSLLCGA